MSDFKPMMSTKSDLDLVTIIHYKFDEYNNEAMDAAFKELKSRKLTELQMSELIDEAEVYSTLPGFVDKPEVEEVVIPTLSDEEKSSAKKRVLLISIFLAISFLIYIIVSIVFDLNDSSIDFWRIKFMENYIILAILPIGIFGLLKQKTYGWIIINLICIHLTLTIFGALYVDAVWLKMIKFYSVLITFPISCYLLNDELMKTYFKVNNKIQKVTIGIGVFLFVVFWAYILGYI